MDAPEELVDAVAEAVAVADGLKLGLLTYPEIVRAVLAVPAIADALAAAVRLRAIEAIVSEWNESERPQSCGWIFMERVEDYAGAALYPEAGK